jgi:AhpD family alkylhydroperoxidase
MQARISNPAMLLPEVTQALMALGAVAKKDYGVPERTLSLMHLRASQINGCSVCVDMHARGLRTIKETDERLVSVAAWRDAPYFTDAERAALALTEAATRMADRSDPVPDEIWNEAARHYSEKELAVLTVHIAMINLWNRINVPTRKVPGERLKPAEAAKWQKEQQHEPAVA